jgi:pSer/pThr/pTyr-binding forkhead associated (FHA) protein
VLVGDDEATEGQRLRLVQLSSLIGRNPACDFPIDHSSISRQHCLLQITDRGLHVRDLGTTNGTRVNGIVLTEGYINVGDNLSMGHLSYIVEKDSPED